MGSTSAQRCFFSLGISLALGVLFFIPFIVHAAARTVPFTPGQTLDPGTDAQPCGPADTNCFPAVVTIKDEGGTLTNSPSILDFVGAGVTATQSGATTTITITGSSGGIISLNGLTTGTQLFATSSDTNIGLSVTSSGSTHTFSPSWTGLLGVGRGGTGLAAVAAGSVLLGNGTGPLATTTRADLLAGTGLAISGSGTNAILGSGVTFSLDINGLSTKTSVSNTDDFIAVYDNTIPGIRKITRGNFLQGLTSALQYQGTWNANTNTPSLSNGTGSAGQVYVVSVASTTVDLGSGALNVVAGDFLIHNGSVWQRAPSGSNVTSVFGRTGAVATSSGDYRGSDVVFSPTGTLSSTNVQSAIAELMGETMTSLNGLTAQAQTFANDTNVTLTSAGSTHTLGWSGILAVGRGGTGISSPSAAGVLLGSYGGGSYQQLATSSLGIALSDTTGVLAINRGGTGTSTAPTYGKVLLGNAGGTYDLVATSSLGIAVTTPFSTTSADYYVHSSTTIPKTYVANAFSALQTFVNASSTNVSSAYASSTSGFFGSLSIGSLSGILKATAGSIATALVNLAADVTGVLPLANGGTGWANVAAGALLYGNGTSALATTTAGTPGQVLALLNGVPTWTATTTLSTISGVLTIAKGGTGTSSAPTYGQLLVGNTGGGFDYLATSSLGLASSLFGTTGQMPYFSGTNVVAGTSTLFISSVGNIGVGTTTPSAQLHIKGVGSGNVLGYPSLLKITTNDSGSWPLVLENLAVGTSSAVSFFADGDSNGGVLRINVGDGLGGNTNPLTIDGEGVFFAKNGNLENMITFEGNSSVGVISENNDVYWLGSAANRQTAPTRVLNWNAAGSVGIGTTTPAATLAIDSIAARPFSLWVGSTTNPWLRVANIGFGTTTVSGFSVSGFATSTSNVGFNLSGGCFAINGTCISGGTSLTGSLGQLAYFSGSNSVVGTSTLFIDVSQGVGVGTSTNIFGGTLTKGLTLNNGLVLASSTALSTTTFALYNNNGTLYWNGSAIGTGSGSVSNSATTTINFDANGAVGVAVTSVDNFNTILIPQTTTGIALTLPNPTAVVSGTTTGKIITVTNTGTVSFTMYTTQVSPSSPSAQFVWTGSAWNPVGGTSNVASEYGENTGITDGQTISTTLADIAGSSFTLPSAGTWKVDFNVVGNLGASNVGVVALYTSGNVLVQGSQAANHFQNTDKSQLIGSAYITTTAAATYKLRGQMNSGTLTISNVPSSLGVFQGVSKITYQKISGNAPVTGQMVDYVQAGLTANQVVSAVQVAAGQDILFNTAQVGNIPLNTSTGVFTLTAGKTYKLDASLRIGAYGGSNDSIDFKWVDANTNSVLSTTVAANDIPITHSANYDLINRTEAIYTPSTNQTVKVRITSGSVTTSATIFASSSVATVQQLGSTAITGDSMVAVGGNTLSGTGGALSIGTLNSNALALVSSSTEALRILATGQTLIGTTTPTSATLFIAGTSTAPTRDLFTIASSSGLALLTVNPAGAVGIGTTTPWAQFSINPSGISGPEFVVGSSSATHFMVSNGGFVGIGTAAPGFPLEIKQTGAATLMIDSGSGNNASMIRLRNGGTSKWAFGNFGTDDSFRFNTGTGIGTNDLFTIRSIGFLGVGTSSPFALMQLATTTGRNLVLSDSAAGTNLKHWLFSSMGGNLYIGTSSDTFATTSIAALTLQGSTGAIGIGTSTNAFGGALTAGLTLGNAFVLGSSTALSTTTNALYNVNGVLYWNGSAVGTGSGGATTFVTNTSSTTLATSAYGKTYKFDTTTGGQVITLPTAAGFSGQSIELIKSSNDINTVLFQGASSQQIASTTYLTLYSQNDAVTIRSDGSNWQIVSDNRSSVGASKDWLQSAANAQQSSISTGTNITFASASTTQSGSNIAFNGSSGFTLKAGKTYRLTGIINWISWSTNPNYARFQWNDGTNFTGTVAHLENIQNAVNGDGTGIATAIVTPTTDTTYTLKTVIVQTGSVTLGDTANGTSFPSVYIEVLNTPQNVVNTLDYSFAYPGTMSNLSSGTDLTPFTAISGNIPFSSSVWTLQAGKTYRLTANLSVSSASAQGTIAWVDGANVELGNAGSTGSGRILYNTTPQTYTTEIIYTATTSTQVKLRTQAGGPVSIQSNGSSVVIQQIGTTGYTGLPFNYLGAAIANGLLDNTNFTQSWDWSTLTTATGTAMTANSLTTGSLLSLTSTSNNLNNTKGLLNIQAYNATSSRLFSIGTTTAGNVLSVFANGTMSIGTTTSQAENVLLVGPAPSSGNIEGGQIGLLPGTTLSTSWMLDNYQGDLRILSGDGRGVSNATRLQVSSTTGALSVLNLASCGGIQTNAAGQMSCTSDERLKDIHNPFTAGLAAIIGISPQAFSWKAGSTMYDGGFVYDGFIAQDVQKALPEAVATSSDGVHLQVSQLTITAALVNSIKDLHGLIFGTSTAQQISTSTISELAASGSLSLDARFHGVAAALDTLASSTATTTDEFGEKTFLGRVFDRIAQWLGDAANGIANLFVKKIHTEELCVKKSDGTELCLTGDQLQAALSGAAGSGSGSGTPAGGSGGAGDTTPPIVSLNGASASSTIAIGATYSDSTTASDETAPANPDVYASVNGAAAVLVNNLTLDTSTSTTYTIEYSATDAAGNVGHATKTVDVQ